jgi:DinB superfamily
MDTPDLQYPVGKFTFPKTVSVDERKGFVDEIAATPARLKAAVAGLSAAQLDTPYRPGGWTVRQLVHHVPESHMNSYIRFKWALTEDEPTIKTYFEDRWAELSDARTSPIEPSLALLESLHQRWITLLRALTEEDWKRTFRHPALGLVRLDQNAALYAWHGRHHVAHITKLRERLGV